MDIQKFDKKDPSLVWEEVSCEHLVQDEWIDFRRVAYRLPDGKVWSPYYNYSRRSYVVIVPETEHGTYLCVRQYRHGIREVTTEFPAGGIETKGDAADYDRSVPAEDALEAAKRELLEETGCVADSFTPLITIPSNATIADNYAHVFLARNCRKVSGQHLDETEFLNVELHSKEEIEELIRTGKFQQMAHVAAWYLAKEKAATEESNHQ